MSGQCRHGQNNGWHKQQGTSAAERFFGQPEKLYPLASFFAPLTNFINRQKPVKILLEKVFNIDSRRNLPEFAGETFEKWFKKNRTNFTDRDRKRVVLLVDIFTNYHEPDAAMAACRILDKLGYDIEFPGIFPTGRPQISKGLVDEASAICKKNIRLKSYAESNVPIVGLEPSEILTLRDEYTDLCSDQYFDTATAIARNTFLWEEFITTELSAMEHAPRAGGATIYVHGHCHTKALVGEDPLMQAFRLMEFQPVALKTGCCGMAGSFGYEADKYDVSMKVGEQVLFPALRSLPDDAVVCAPGFSCRHQITDGTKRKALHPAVIMENAFGGM